MPGSGLHDQLASVLARVIEGFESLLACDQLTAGASQETFRVRVASASGEQQFALRTAR